MFYVICVIYVARNFPNNRIFFVPFPPSRAEYIDSTKLDSFSARVACIYLQNVNEYFNRVTTASPNGRVHFIFL